MTELFYWRDVQYHDEPGRVIHERVPEAGIPPADFVRFRTVGTLTATLPSGEKHKHDFVVLLPEATTPAEAFAMAEAETKKQKGPAIEVLARKIEELTAAARALVQPNAAQTQKILGGPNGRRRRLK